VRIAATMGKDGRHQDIARLNLNGCKSEILRQAKFRRFEMVGPSCSCQQGTTWIDATADELLMGRNGF
jgi:hypothetical protein